MLKMKIIREHYLIGIDKMKEIIQFIILKIHNQRVKFYILWNRLYFWLCDVDYGRNMKVFNQFYLKKSKGAQLLIGNNFLFLSGGQLIP